jgi:hypothetical protein
MKSFEQRDIAGALAHAKAGGQALHLCSRSFVSRSAPAVFRNAECFAHLFDGDRARLVATAKRLGVLCVIVDRDGEPGQHVDLAGRPLERAEAEAACPLVQGELF